MQPTAGLSFRRAGLSAEPMLAGVCGHSGKAVRSRSFVNNLLPECPRQGCGTGAILRRKLIEMNWITHPTGTSFNSFAFIAKSIANFMCKSFIAIYTLSTLTKSPSFISLNFFRSKSVKPQILQSEANLISSPIEIGVFPNPITIEFPTGQ